MEETYFDGENVLKVNRTNDDVIVEYYLNDDLHRKDGPAVIEHYEDGSVKVEAYYRNNYLHRQNGPADIWYDINGNIKRKEYWVDGSYIVWMAPL